MRGRGGDCASHSPRAVTAAGTPTVTKVALPAATCRLCGFEAADGGSFTQHLGAHAAEGDGVRTATDVVCANCGACFAGRVPSDHACLEPILDCNEKKLKYWGKVGQQFVDKVGLTRIF